MEADGSDARADRGRLGVRAGSAGQGAIRLDDTVDDRLCRVLHRADEPRRLEAGVLHGAGVPGIDEMELAHGYPYILLSGKTAIHTNAHTHNVPFLNMLMSDNPVWIHPETAAKEGLKDGDKIITKRLREKQSRE